jgi:hypothetical protein
MYKYPTSHPRMPHPRHRAHRHQTLCFCWLHLAEHRDPRTSAVPSPCSGALFIIQAKPSRRGERTCPLFAHARPDRTHGRQDQHLLACFPPSQIPTPKSNRSVWVYGGNSVGPDLDPVRPILSSQRPRRGFFALPNSPQDLNGPSRAPGRAPSGRRPAQ